MNKKNQHKLTHTLSGIVLALAITLCCLEYKTISSKNYKIQSKLIQLEEEPILEIEIPKPPPPPPPPPNVAEEIEVVKDEKVIDKPILILNEDQVDLVIDIEPEPQPVIEQIFDVVEENPEFFGGIQKLYEYLGKQLQYPEIARQNMIQGKVFVQFVVWKDGSIRKVKIVKGVHKTLDNEALRVVKSMPKWKPGKQRGKRVNTKFTLPIKFKIG